MQEDKKVITMKEKQEIILKYFREGYSLRQISRDLDLNRKTVTKYVNGYKSQVQILQGLNVNNPEELIEDISLKPKYNSLTRKKRKITSQLLKEVQYSLDLNKHRRLSCQQKKQQMVY